MDDRDELAPWWLILLRLAVYGGSALVVVVGLVLVWRSYAP